MSTTEINLYNKLKVKIGDNEAKELIEFIDFRSEEKRTNADRFIATKQDISALRLELKDTKNDLLKWFVGLFITLVLMILGLYATILLK